MKHRVLKPLIAAALFAAALPCLAQTKIPKDAFLAVITKTYDGDNIYFYAKADSFNKSVFKGRLACANTPELKSGVCKKEQPGAQQAKVALASAVPVKATVIIDTLSERDAYGRLQCRVWFSTDGKTTTDLSFAMISAGLAWYEYNPKVPRSALDAYRKAFEVAKMSQTGIWDSEEYPEKPVNPRKWRKKYGPSLIFKLTHRKPKNQ